VLDVLLPSISGYTVAQRLRGEEIWTPILMLTAKDGEYDEADGLDVGADDYLRKPFSFVVLIARLRALARRGAVPRPRLLSHGGLTLDPESGECTVHGEPAVLQPLPATTRQTSHTAAAVLGTILQGMDHAPQDPERT
jgi:DNA-binding response OmpR family regulator